MNSVTVTSYPVSAQRKLSAKWSIDLESDLKAMHGIDLDAELAASILEEMFQQSGRKFISIGRNDYPESIFKHLVQTKRFIIGVTESNGKITVYGKGKVVKKGMTKEEWNERYFTDML